VPVSTAQLLAHLWRLQVYLICRVKLSTNSAALICVWHSCSGSSTLTSGTFDKLITDSLQLDVSVFAATRACNSDRAHESIDGADRSQIFFTEIGWACRRQTNYHALLAGVWQCHSSFRPLVVGSGPTRLKRHRSRSVLMLLLQSFEIANLENKSFRCIIKPRQICLN